VYAHSTEVVSVVEMRIGVCYGDTYSCTCMVVSYAIYCSRVKEQRGGIS
jgi:hypothetical protein